MNLRARDVQKHLDVEIIGFTAAHAVCMAKTGQLYGQELVNLIVDLPPMKDEPAFYIDKAAGIDTTETRVVDPKTGLTMTKKRK